jgi:hypothetical protein
MGYNFILLLKKGLRNRLMFRKPFFIQKSKDFPNFGF